MAERLTTYVEGFALNDFFQGTQVGLVGTPSGFEVGALFRLPRVTDESEPNVEQQLVWGSGDLAAANPSGWAIYVQQVNNVLWNISFVISTVLGTVSGVTFAWSSVDLPADEHTLFAHCIFSPDISPLGVGAGAGVAMYLQGVLVVATTKVSYEPALAPPAIGNTVLAGPITEPRISVAGVSYRETDPAFDGHFADVYQQVTATGDLRQLPAGEFQWDNLWSARRGLPDVTDAAQLWTDEVNGFQLQRTGGGNSLQCNAGKPHYWSI